MEEERSPTVWRLNLVTAADGDRDPREFCFERGLLGFGWRLEAEPPSGLGSRDFLRWAKDNFPHEGEWTSYKSAFEALSDRMEPGDLCWARDTNGIYYLAEVGGDWEYRDDEPHRAVDIHHFRRCTWHKIGTADQVPASLIEAFQGWTLCRYAKDEPAARWRTRCIHARETDAPEPPMPEDPSVWSLLSADDVEDVVATFLQHQGFVVIPSTAKRSTPGYEFSLVGPSGRIAIVQVKKGRLDPRDYADYEEDVVLFARRGYRASAGDGVRCLERKRLEAFMKEHPGLLPPRVRDSLETLDLT